MSDSKVGRVLCSIIAVASVTVLSARAQTPGAVPRVKREVAPIVRPDSGDQMFKAYCAACHGADGKGNGPAAPAMKTMPTDLTRLAANNGGTFPTKDVTDVLRFGSPLAAHGSPDMPIWGPTFRAMDDESIVTLRVSNLVEHLKSLQTR
jgi:mono/diheme cytochrome c family protein